MTTVFTAPIFVVFSTGGMGKAKATDWDLNVMFEEVFKDLSSLRKVLAEDTLRQLNAQVT